MKHLLALLFLLLVPVTGAGAQDFDRGQKAYDQGDHTAALAQWLPLAEQGNADAQFTVSLIYSKGDSGLQDNAAAARWLRAAAEQGLGSAQIRLGQAYRGGYVTPQDNVLAYMWFHLANGAKKWRASDSEFFIRGQAEYAGYKRDRTAADMSPADIAEAERRAREWRQAHPQ